MSRVFLVLFSLILVSSQTSCVLWKKKGSRDAEKQAVSAQYMQRSRPCAQPGLSGYAPQTGCGQPMVVPQQFKPVYAPPAVQQYQQQPVFMNSVYTPPPVISQRYVPAPSYAPAPAIVQPKNYIIYFGLNKDGIDSSARNVLEQVLSDLNSNSSATVTLSGHTDRSGNISYNEKLAQRRVESAKQWLLGKSIQSYRIKTSSAGENSNAINTKDGVIHRSNRRVEISIR